MAEKEKPHKKAPEAKAQEKPATEKAPPKAHVTAKAVGKAPASKPAARIPKAPAKETAKAPQAERVPKRKPHRVVASHGAVNVYSLDGGVARTTDLPHVFHEPLRPDLIRRAVTAAQANRRQPYGQMFNAGRRHSVRWPGKGGGVARTPRIRGTMIGAQAPNTVGGARAHPPRVEKVWAKKINEGERRRARAAAVAALKEAELVRARGHQFDAKLTLPVVVEDDIEKALPKLKGEPDPTPTKAAVRVLEALGIAADVDRVRRGTHIRAGRGKMRGRRYRTPRGPLFVVKEPGEVRRHFGNLPGVEVRSVSQLDVEVLAPGGDAGRLTVFSAGALEALRGW
jgi:large subunit ribosomal protein L4e